MKVLVVGSGGREYALGEALKKDKSVEKIWFAPGNGATKTLGDNIGLSDHGALADFALEQKIDLVVIGPEQPLVDGMSDLLESKGLNVFGCSKEAARLEGSKAFMKHFADEIGLPTARYLETRDLDEAIAFIDSLPAPVVVKADGLCAGKGVIIAKSHAEAHEAARTMLSGEAFGEAGQTLVVEEFLDGYELSVFAICDGERFIVLPAAQDHKRLLDGDEGPNTGGMGAYAPTPLIDKQLSEKISERIITPAIEGMKKKGTPFKGVLFCGIMVCDSEPLLLEFNVRFGDPECEILMPLLKTPAGELLFAAATGRLDSISVECDLDVAVGVVMASQNYPYGKSDPAPITLNENLTEELEKFTSIAFAGVSEKDGSLFASGGRVLVCIGRGETVQMARDRAYARLETISFNGAQFRSDIAHQAL